MLVKSTYRFPYKRERLFQFETIVPDFIKKYSKLDNHRDGIPLFIEVKEKLMPLTTIPYEKEAFEKFDFISWPKSKIDNTPFVEILKRKMNNDL